MSSNSVSEYKRELLPAEFAENRGIVTAELICNYQAFEKMAGQLGKDKADGYLLALADISDAMQCILNRERNGYNFAETAAMVRSKAGAFNEHIEQFLLMAFSESGNKTSDPDRKPGVNSPG